MTMTRTTPARARPMQPARDLDARALRIATDALQARGARVWEIDEHGSQVLTAEAETAVEDARASLIAEHGDPMVTARHLVERLLSSILADHGGAWHARRDLAVTEMAGADTDGASWAAFVRAEARELRTRYGEKYGSWVCAEAARRLGELERSAYLQDVVKGFERAQTDYHPSVGRTIRAYFYRCGARAALRLEVPVRVRHGWGFAVLSVPLCSVTTPAALVDAALAVFGIRHDWMFNPVSVQDGGRVPASKCPRGFAGIAKLVEERAARDPVADAEDRASSDEFDPCARGAL